MSRRARAFPPLLVLSLLLSFLSSSTPAAAQSATPDAWRKGAAAVSDAFNPDTSQWTVDAGRDAYRAVARGRLVVHVPEAELFRWSTLENGGAFKDFYAEVDAYRQAGPEDGMMGIIFRYVDADDFYAFLISADGWYALLKYVDGELSRVIDWTESDKLNTGAGAENTLAVLADGSELAVFANNEELDRVQDRSLSEGQVALVGGTGQNGDLEVSFDNFGLWKPSASSSTPTVGHKGLARPTPTAGPTADTADAAVASETLNVRSGPGTNYSVVGILKKGNGVKVLGRSADNKWTRLSFADVREAWASTQYLSFNIDYGQVAVAKPPATPASTKPPASSDKKNVAWLVIENHIGRYITVQVNDQVFRVEGKVGSVPGRFRFELQGAGRYRVTAQLPNAGGHNWDLYVEATPDRCVDRQGCIALGQSFLQTYY